LRHALRVLEGVGGIGFVHFTDADVVRHPLVARIVRAYDRAEGQMRVGTKYERDKAGADERED
jgi:phosphate starvation-inducible PhoH-like protein